MATKSIFQSININETKQGKALIIALESASRKKTKNVQLSRPYKDIQGAQLRSILNR